MSAVNYGRFFIAGGQLRWESSWFAISRSRVRSPCPPPSKIKGLRLLSQPFFIAKPPNCIVFVQQILYDINKICQIQIIDLEYGKSRNAPKTFDLWVFLPVLKTFNSTTIYNNSSANQRVRNSLRGWTASQSSSSSQRIQPGAATTLLTKNEVD